MESWHSLPFSILKPLAARLNVRVRGGGARGQARIDWRLMKSGAIIMLKWFVCFCVTYVNLLLTMVLGGLWHGANWTFVAWGGLHGGVLAADKFRASLDKRSKAKSGIRVSLRLFVGWVVTTLIVLVGWILFRAQSFPTVFTMIRKMFFLEGGLHWVLPFVYVAILATIVDHLTAEMPLLKRFRTCDIRTVYGASVLLSLFLVALIYRPLGFQPFIYFQF